MTDEAKGVNEETDEDIKTKKRIAEEKEAQRRSLTDVDENTHAVYEGFVRSEGAGPQYKSEAAYEREASVVAYPWRRVGSYMLCVLPLAGNARPRHAHTPTRHARTRTRLLEGLTPRQAYPQVERAVEVVNEAA